MASYKEHVELAEKHLTNASLLLESIRRTVTDDPHSGTANVVQATAAMAVAYAQVALGHAKLADMKPRNRPPMPM